MTIWTEFFVLNMNSSPIPGLLKKSEKILAMVLISPSDRFSKYVRVMVKMFPNIRSYSEQLATKSRKSTRDTL
jgi:hypothetical protein